MGAAHLRVGQTVIYNGQLATVAEVPSRSDPEEYQGMVKIATGYIDDQPGQWVASLSLSDSEEDIARLEEKQRQEEIRDLTVFASDFDPDPYIG